MTTLTSRPLSAAAFSPFGQVLDLRHSAQRSINAGQTLRYHDLARLECASVEGQPLISIFRTEPLAYPHPITCMECHPKASQTFYPVNGARFYVLVAPAGPAVRSEDLMLFLSDGCQGVHFNPGTWHHFQLALDRRSDFIVVDWADACDNLIECAMDGSVQIPPPPPLAAH